ncbi:MAG: DUF1295 domain-containing protein [Actinomycetota bacterium]
MESPALILGVNAAVTVAAMIGLWAASLRLRDASIVDVFWGPGFIVLGLVTLGLADGYGPRRLYVFALTAAWGLRLAFHLFRRNWGKGEDYRYAAMRKRYGARFGLVSLVTVFGLQAALMWIVSLPVQFAQMSWTPKRFLWVDVLGGGLWAVGLAFESIADRQLRRFKAHPRNRRTVMDRGLWRYTRHPNYFGEALIWWGFFAVSLVSTMGWWTVVSPLVMTFFLTRVSGVPPLERRMVRTRPGYRAYIRRTSTFFPLPPRDRARA